MLQIPIFHVNGEDPEAVAQACGWRWIFATSSSATWSSTCIVTAASATTKATSRPSRSPCCIGRSKDESLSARATSSACSSWARYTRGRSGPNRRRASANKLDERALRSQERRTTSRDPRRYAASGRDTAAGRRADGTEIDDRVAKSDLSELLGGADTSCPTIFTRIRRSNAACERAARWPRASGPLDWSAGRGVGLCQPCDRGYRVRLSGQDSARGTFSQRHAVLYDYRGRAYLRPSPTPLARPGPGRNLQQPALGAGVLGFRVRL